jgi:hypothetical protein
VTDTPSLKGERVVLVDGTALVYRAFFAIPPHLKAKEGRLTNATFGFASMFKKLFWHKRPRFGAVVVDAPGRTFLIECHGDDADTVARLCKAEMERRDIGDVTLKGAPRRRGGHRLLEG